MGVEPIPSPSIGSALPVSYNQYVSIWLLAVSLARALVHV